MDLNQIVREIVDERIAAIGNPKAADPVLLTVSEVAEKHPNLGKQTIYTLCRNQAETGFPCVRIGKGSLLIDNNRLNQWIAAGGLGVEA